MKRLIAITVCLILTVSTSHAAAYQTKYSMSQEERTKLKGEGFILLGTVLLIGAVVANKNSKDFKHGGRNEGMRGRYSDASVVSGALGLLCINVGVSYRF